jgi:GT2 family glycosyltransferase
MINYDDITVGMVHFNRPKLLLRTLPSYSKFGEVIVWDNGSVVQNKYPLQALARKFSNFNPIFHNENIGFASALNRIIINSKTDWILLTADDMLLGWNRSNTRH